MREPVPGCWCTRPFRCRRSLTATRFRPGTSPTRSSRPACRRDCSRRPRTCPASRRRGRSKLPVQRVPERPRRPWIDAEFRTTAAAVSAGRPWACAPASPFHRTPRHPGRRAFQFASLKSASHTPAAPPLGGAFLMRQLRQRADTRQIHLAHWRGNGTRPTGSRLANRGFGTSPG